MKAGRREKAGAVAVFCMVLSLVVNIQAAAPTGSELDAAIKTGDFGAYSVSLATWLGAELPADTNKISEQAVKALLDDPAVANAVDQWQLLTRVGAANVGAFAKSDQQSQAFLAWVLKDTKVMDLCLLACVPTGLKAREEDKWTLPVDALELWKKIYYADSDSRQGLYLKLAIATAIAPPGRVGIGAGGPPTPADPLVRYQYYKTAHKNRELVPSFDKLSVWDYTKIVSSGASDEDLTWGREMVNTFRPDLIATEMVVDMTGLVWRRNSPVPYSNMKTVLQGGGKCGPRSSFAVFINHAFGIPAIGVAQPAHACVAWRGVDGVWRVGYGRGWGASRLDGLTGPDFVEGSLARSRADQFSQVEHLRWLASAMASHGQTAAVLGIAKKIALAAPATKTDMNESLKPEEANADPGVEAAKAGAATTKKETVTGLVDGVFKPVNGVIHVEAAAFAKQEGQSMFGGPSIIVQDCHLGGRQIYFPQQLSSCWTEYKVDAPAAGKYELTMQAAAVNDGQMLQVGSDAFNAVALVRIPMSHGLWATTQPVNVKLIQGVQKIQVSVIAGQRGVAVRGFDLKPAGQ
jgi:hypothetical protein